MASDFETQAQASFDDEMKDVKRAAEEMSNAEDFDASRENVNEYLGEPLEVSFVRCAQILLTTGGPARGYHIFIDSDGEPDSGYYWYQDWFQPKRIFWLDSAQLAEVVTAYDLYLGD